MLAGCSSRAPAETGTGFSAGSSSPALSFRFAVQSRLCRFEIRRRERVTIAVVRKHNRCRPRPAVVDHEQRDAAGRSPQAVGVDVKALLDRDAGSSTVVPISRRHSSAAQ